MSDQGGVSLVELAVSVLVAAIIFLALGFMYLMTTRSFVDANSQAALQRQGTLAMDEIARRVRSAVSSPPAVQYPVTNIGSGKTVTACNNVAVGQSVSLNTPDGTICYYGLSSGQLCEYLGSGCRNVLSGATRSIFLMTQTNPADQRCPTGVIEGHPCLVLTAGPGDGGQSATISFTIMDAPQSRLRLANVMTFSSTVSCAARSPSGSQTAANC